MNDKPQWDNSRCVIERVYIRGELTLDTPAHFGNGDAEGLADIPLVYDPLDGQTPLLTGASIAGALRNYVREREHGYGWAEKPAAPKSLAERLFGHLILEAVPGEPRKTKKATVLSWLVVDDARGQPPLSGESIELRDGVAIDPATRTVEQDERGGHKYDIELLAAGTTFTVSFEFWRTQENGDLLTALADALRGLEDGQIGLGMRKRRGFGRCHVGSWQVWRYPMTTVEGLLGWLNHTPSGGQAGPHIADLLRVALAQDDARQAFTLDATFALESSMLIRSDTGSGNAPDMTHLRSWRAGTEKPILSGTSLAGVIRARALRIANTVLGQDPGVALVNAMFGRRRKPDSDESPTGSWVTVQEHEIKDGLEDSVQSRVKLDRFTGGAYPQALFSQRAVWGKTSGHTLVMVNLTLRRPWDMSDADWKAQVGLLLLVLKDLWTGDLPVGGESSVGRGRLRGVKATMTCDGQTWVIKPGEKDQLEIDGRDQMEKRVEAFRGWKGDARQGGEPV